MLDKIANEIVAYRGLSYSRRILLYLKTPDLIKDMEKELDSTLKSFQVFFPVRYRLMTLDVYSSTQLDFSIITTLDVVNPLDGGIRIQGSSFTNVHGSLNIHNTHNLNVSVDRLEMGEESSPTHNILRG